MSQPQPPQRQPDLPQPDRHSNALQTTAVIGLVVCPALALLPPRKLDFYTVGLITATGYSANLLVRERTGRSIYQHLSPQRRTALSYEPSSDPQTERANLRRELGDASEELRQLEKRWDVTKERLDRREERQGQREAWKTQREKEIKDGLEEGKGLSDMIFDQIWEVWHWRKKSDEEDAE